jgi:hypothetical protein
MFRRVVWQAARLRGSTLMPAAISTADDRIIDTGSNTAALTVWLPEGFEPGEQSLGGKPSPSKSPPLIRFARIFGWIFRQTRGRSGGIAGYLRSAHPSRRMSCPISPCWIRTR